MSDVTLEQIANTPPARPPYATSLDAVLARELLAVRNEMRAEFGVIYERIALERSVAPEEASGDAVTPVLALVAERDDALRDLSAAQEHRRSETERAERAERELAEARAEVEAEDRERMTRLAAIDRDVRDRLTAERDAARDDATRLRVALMKYGRHQSICMGGGDSCICGFRVALDGAAT